jgi:polysaccharide export outer membrane protein
MLHALRGPSSNTGGMVFSRTREQVAFGHQVACVMVGMMHLAILKHMKTPGLLAMICLLGSVAFGQETDTAKANMPAPEAATGMAVAKIPESATSQFKLGPADVVHINVWKNTELSQTVTVGPDGFISLPLLNDIHVAGMTANELAQELNTKLNNYIMNPQVTVSVVDIRSRQVYVLGQVGKPGGYPLVGPMNVLQLIAQAGGLSTYANRKGITILRASKDGTEKIHFNYNNVVHGDGKQNVFLQPGDTVVVP